jgi:DNA (cytosine-5)-methyltransferase 1
LNAGSYGTPQDRERLILLGARRVLTLPEYPKITSLMSGVDLKLPGLSAGPTCADALSDLPDAEDFDELLENDSVRTRKWGGLSAYAAEMRCTTSAAWHYGYRRKWNPTILTSSMRTDHTAISRRRFADTPPGTVESISRFLKLPHDGVANTLRAGTDSARGAFTSPRPIHFRYPRCITVREMARLHGFPDWMRFHVTKWHGARQVGNAVPPPLARAIALQIIKAAGYRPERTRKALSLGDSALLRLNMAQAARFWGVPVPIGKRDRKSAFRKRKQIEIESLRERQLSYA